MHISYKLSLSPNFRGYTYVDEMVGDAIENCYTSIKTFNPEKSNNPFGYFTQVAKQAMIRRIDKEKKQQYIKHKYLQTFKEIYDGDHKEFDPDYLENDEKSYEVIKDYESFLTRKREKVKVRNEKI